MVNTLLAIFGGCQAGSPLPQPRDDSDDTDTAATPVGELVVVTLNTHSFQEGADSLDKLQWIGEGLAALNADIVGLNEVMSGTFWAYDYNGAKHDGTQIIKQALEEASGVSWYVAEAGFGHWDSGEEMANVLLLRTPIDEFESRSLTTTDFWPAPEQRNVVYGRTEIANLGKVNIFVTHTWGWDSADTDAQITEVKSFILEKFRGDEALDLLLGDLNVAAGSAAYETWLDANPFRLIDTYGKANPDGFSDSTVVGGENRIDYILAGEGWSLSEDPANYASSLVFDGTDLPLASDHLGVMTVFVY